MTDDQQYDDTNRGAWFRPKGEEQFSLEGRINVEGREIRTFLFKETSKQDEDYWRVCTDDSFHFVNGVKVPVYRQIGLIFKSRIVEEGQANVTGFIHLGLTEKRLAAWRNTKGDMVYYGVKVSDPYVPQGDSDKSDQTMPAHPYPDDDIPF